MTQLFIGLLLIAGIVISMAGLAAVRHSSLGALITMAGLVMVVIAWLLDARRVRLHDLRTANEIAHRTAALTARPWATHERLEVPANRLPLALTLGTALVGIWMVMHFGFGGPVVNWPLFLTGTACLLFGVLMAPSALASIGKPSLVLDRAGLRTPVDGWIPWSAVEGIYRQVLDHRGLVRHVLCFSVPAYATVVQPIHWVQRWLALFGLGALRRGRVRVLLVKGREQPEAVEAVARHLWKSATGRQHLWIPELSTRVNQALRRLGDLERMMASPGEMERALQDDANETVARMEQVARDGLMVNQELNAQRRKQIAVGWVALAVMLLLIAWPWIKRLLAS